MKKILITGGSGYMGDHFADYFDTLGDEVEYIQSRVDITDHNLIKEEVIKHNPDIILNCAGKTGRPNVDWCEDHKYETYKVNVYGALNLLNIAEENDIKLVHIGSGCVYGWSDGSREFDECDEPNFEGSYYSKTKAYSEKILKDYNVLQLRIRMPLESKPNPKNLITKLINYEQVISVPNSATIIEDFLPAAWNLIKNNKTGIYNMTNSGSFTHDQVLELYKKHIDPEHQYKVISLEELSKLTVAGRSNCVLATEKLENEEVSMPPVQDRLEDLIIEYKNNL